MYILFEFGNDWIKNVSPKIGRHYILQEYNLSSLFAFCVKQIVTEIYRFSWTEHLFTGIVPN